MGNWMTVNIVGKIAADEVAAARGYVNVGSYNDDTNEWDRLGPLSYVGPSACGLGLWPAEEFNVVGNLAERDYTPEDVREALEELVRVAPSAHVTVYCGGNYESTKITAIVVAVAGRVVTVSVPANAEISSERFQEESRERIATMMRGAGVIE